MSLHPEFPGVFTYLYLRSKPQVYVSVCLSVEFLCVHFNLARTRAFVIVLVRYYVYDFIQMFNRSNLHRNGIIYTLLVSFRCLNMLIKLVQFVNETTAPLSSACTLRLLACMLQPTTIGPRCL